jgi:hypothetical protein
MSIAGLVDTDTGAAVDPDTRYESALGNPGTTGHVLSSTTAGVRSWVAQSGGGGGVDTANSPAAGEFARFTDADTIEGRTAAEARADLDLEPGVDVPRWLTDVAGASNADNTAAVNTRLVTDISGYTATRTTTLPATFAVGDLVEVYLSGGDDTYMQSVVPASGDTIDGGAAGAEHTKLYITGEKIRYRGVVANSAWTVDYDGRYKGLLFEAVHDGVNAVDRQEIPENTFTALLGSTVATGQTGSRAAWRVINIASPMFTQSTGVFRPLQAGQWLVEASVTIGPVGAGSSAIAYLQHSTDGTTWTSVSGQARLATRQMNLGVDNTPGSTGVFSVRSASDADRWRVAVFATVGVGGVAYCPAFSNQHNFARFAARRV